MEKLSEVTLGGLPHGARRKRPTAPSERPTQPSIEVEPTSSPSPDLSPPDRATALAHARMFLSGPDGQVAVGIEGCEAMERRIVADYEESAAR